MSNMTAPSMSLLRAFFKPVRCSSCQIREASNYVPRAKYARITALDKLHRQQKANLRKERLDSVIRAQNMQSIPSYGVAQVDATETRTSTTGEVEPSSPLVSSSSLSSSSPPLQQPPPSFPALRLPYQIQRTPSQQLPIYQKAKGGGTKHITTVRKLSGNLGTLQTHLREALGLQQFIEDRKGRKKETVAINHRTRQIVVRGWRGPEIKKWAELVGF